MTTSSVSCESARILSFPCLPSAARGSIHIPLLLSLQHLLAPAPSATIRDMTGAPAMSKRPLHCSCCCKCYLLRRVRRLKCNNCVGRWPSMLDVAQPRSARCVCYAAHHPSGQTLHSLGTQQARTRAQISCSALINSAPSARFVSICCYTACANTMTVYIDTTRAMHER
jgi:hypothetical protein